MASEHEPKSPKDLSLWEWWLVVLWTLRLVPKPPAQTGWAMKDLVAAARWRKRVDIMGVLWAIGLLVLTALLVSQWL